MTKEDQEFYTVRRYALQQQEDGGLTPSMEDYLEMACRLSQGKGFVRVGDLAASLNVQPPSATKMLQKMAELGYANYEKYGVVNLTKTGASLGADLLWRHEAVARFLQILGVTEGLLEETEKIEHSLSCGTVERMIFLVEFLKDNQEWEAAYAKFAREKSVQPAVINIPG
ncbi:MAG: DtxR family transcriptional regulator [Syntrophomonadaceae bacterium]|nr:DtxR family transcriptional regulator [Syntrophomonadaceae bacterium]